MLRRGLLDSHKSSRVMYRPDGPESVQSPRHSNRSGFSMTTVPPSRRARTQATRASDPLGYGFFRLSVLPGEGQTQSVLTCRQGFSCQWAGAGMHGQMLQCAPSNLAIWISTNTIGKAGEEDSCCPCWVEPSLH